MKVLVIGSGAREAALIFKLSKSESIEEIFVFPGNPAWILDPSTKYFGVLPALAEIKDPSVKDIILAAKSSNIDSVVVGPEQSLSQGIVDCGQEEGVYVFGPHLQNALLESSKHFAKEVMLKAKVPTAGYAFFKSSELEALNSYARNHFLQNPSSKLVLKVSCLAAGKGVVICEDWNAFQKALEYLSKDIGVDVDGFVVEEFLHGRECSYFIICDGRGGYERLGFAVDYKRRYEQDLGPNTGGMGAYTPVSWLPSNAADMVDEKIVRPLFNYFSSSGLHYRGFLYVGLMWNHEGPKVVEFNVRLGDPEAQVLALSSSLDWGSYIQRAQGSGESLGEGFSYSREQSSKHSNAAVAVVLSHPDYPSIRAKEDTKVFWTKENMKSALAEYLKLENLTPTSLQVFLASCLVKEDQIIPGKGRVLTIVSTGVDVEKARECSYKFIEIFSQKLWKNAGYRKDIAEHV